MPRHNDSLEAIVQDVNKLNHAVFGGDEPDKSLILRIDRLEHNNPDDLSVRMDRLEKNAEARDFYFKALVVAVIGTIVSVVAFFIQSHIH